MTTKYMRRAGNKRSMWRTSRSMLLGSALSLVTWATVAQGASDTSSPDDADAPLPSAAADAGYDPQGDILVTALRRSSTVQQTPIAITAISGDTLTAAGITDIPSAARLVPSLRIEDNGPGSQRLSMRGIRTAGEATVGLYYDDMPVAGSVGYSSDAGGNTPNFALFDVERVEALRGPQGTLYGAGSMSGTIRVILKKPVDDYEGSVEGSGAFTDGGDASYMVNGMVNVPVVDGLLAARVVGYRQRIGGYVDNIRTQRDNINDSLTDGGRVMLRLTPADSLTLDASAAFEDVDAAFGLWNDRLGKYKWDAQVKQPYTSRSQIYNLTARYDVGSATVTAVGSYQKRKFVTTPGDDSFYAEYMRMPGGCAFNYNIPSCSGEQLAQYYDYIDSITPLMFITPGDMDDITGELRATSNGDGRLNWTVGAYIEHRREDLASKDVVASPDTLEINQPVEIIYLRPIGDDYRQYAGYGELSFKATDQLTLTAGLRYYSYKRTVSGNLEIPWPLFGEYDPTPPSSFETSEKGTLLKFNADYQFTSDLMVYASATQGYRPGGANQVIGLDTELTPYKSDQLWDYELGLKSAFFGHNLLVNVAVFQLDWTDIQVKGTTPSGDHVFMTNAGAARVRGAEFELTARPVDSLNLSANLTLLDAKLTEGGTSSDVSTPVQAGDRMPYVPHVMAGVNAEYRQQVGGLSGYARLDANYVGRSYSTFRETDPMRIAIKAYTLANARIGVDGDNWGMYVFANNVFNSVAINQASQTAYPHSYNVTSATPRTIGVGLRREF